MDCIICSKELKWRQKKFCCNNCKAKWHYSSSNSNNYDKQKQRWRKRKLYLIKLSWWCCNMCGYKKNYSALEFHHLYDKSFKLDTRKLSNSKICDIMKEYEKCQLLCANCHREMHNNDCVIGDLDKEFIDIMKENESNKCINCAIDITSRALRCIKCRSEERIPKNKPKKEELIIMMYKKSMERVWRQYWVSWKTIKKWINEYWITKMLIYGWL